MLVPEYKWDGAAAKSLYTLAILKDGAIRSVRDLTGAHAPMLRALRAGVLAELARRYGVRADQLRCYFHYLPSFWHAHIHFAALTCRLPCRALSGRWIRRAAGCAEVQPEPNRRRARLRGGALRGDGHNAQ